MPSMICMIYMFNMSVCLYWVIVIHVAEKCSAVVSLSPDPLKEVTG